MARAYSSVGASQTALAYSLSPTTCPSGSANIARVLPGAGLNLGMTTLPPSPGSLAGPVTPCTNTQTTPCGIGQFVLSLAPDS